MLPAVRFHDLRHTCATLLLMAEANVKDVADRLGHSNPATLLRTYAHVLPQGRQQTADRIGAYLP